MLPRPARILRQAPLLTRSTASTSGPTRHLTNYASAQARERANRGQIQVVRQPASPELDESFRSLINDSEMGMGIGMADNYKRGGDEASGRRSHSRVNDLEIVRSPGPSAPHRFGLAPDRVLEDEGEMRSRRDGGAEHYEGEEALEGGEEGGEREERRSPAAVLGSKRVGVVVLPQEMKDGIQAQIDQLEDPRQLRESYLALPSSKKREEKHDHRSGRPRRTEEGELAKAAAVLPGEYAVVRNVLHELRRRLGRDWLAHAAQAGEARAAEDVEIEGVRGEIEVVEFSGGLGSGMWSTLDALEALPSSSSSSSFSTTAQQRLKFQLVHSSRHGLDLATKIAAGVPERNADLHFNRKHVPSSVPPSLILSTFLLSKLPTRPSQQSHLSQLLSLNSPYLVLIDRSTPEGWQAMSSARSFLLDQATSENPLHVVAPCPHDGVCPLVSTRDTCGFSQRLQRPSFLRKTKHSGRGEEDTGYCYLVIARGERPGLASGTEPMVSDEQTQAEILRTAGRLGGVGREATERAALKTDGRGVLTEIEGAEGVLEVVHLLVESEDQSSQQSGPSRVDRNELDNSLRREAYTWPRMVAPPMKRSGHVTIDACCPDGESRIRHLLCAGQAAAYHFSAVANALINVELGNIQRLTYSKSHSRQGYHDARKSSWGDLFPHEPKANPVVRTRGVRRLSRAEKADEEEGADVIKSIMAGEADADLDTLAELEKLGIKAPRAELVDGADRLAEDVTVWKGKSPDRSFAAKGQRRGLLTTARPKPFISLLGPLVASQKRNMSARPTTSRSSSPRAKVTIAELHRLASTGEPITCLTAYDYPTALLSEQCGVDMVLIGDSLSQVALGYESTTSITLDEMIHHARAVCRGAKTPFTFADMPFGSFEASIEDGVKGVMRMIKEGGVDGVKIEGGKEIVPLIKRLSEIGIPVIPHLGLQPQRATSLSGYLVQGRTAESAYEILQTAREMKQAGAFAVLLEAIPANVAKTITEDVGLTIGIGAGRSTSGQVLVITDVLGTYAEDAEPEDVVVRSTSAELQAGTGTGTGAAAGGIQAPLSSTSTSQTQLSDSAATSTISTTSTAPTTPKPAGAPRFVRQFGAVGPHARKAVRAYVRAVKDGSFPDSKESYGMKKDDQEAFARLVAAESVST